MRDTGEKIANYAYFPIEVDEKEFGMSRDVLYEKLRQYNVYARKYFYPLLCDYACYSNIIVKDPLTVARRVSDHILTLPIYEDLQLSDVQIICEMIKYLQAGNDSCSCG